MMRTRNKISLIGFILLLSGGPALAHDRVGHAVYPDNRWSGALTLYGDSRGYAGWSGSLNYAYGVSYGYLPAYVTPVPVYDHRHGPSCRHSTGHQYGKSYRKGYSHGRNHSRRGGYGHGHHH